MQQNEPKANRPDEAKIIEPCGDTDEVTILTRQKQESDNRVAALEKARSRVAFFGRPRKRAAHPRHLLFPDCYDDWTLQRIEQELRDEQNKNELLERELARAKALRQQQTKRLQGAEKGSDIFSHTQDYRSVTRRGLTFNLTTRQAQIIGILHAAFKDGHPDVPQARILEEIQTGSRVRDSFRKSGKEIPAWKALVEQGERKGTFRLKL